MRSHDNPNPNPNLFSEERCLGPTEALSLIRCCALAITYLSSIVFGNKDTTQLPQLQNVAYVCFQNVSVATDGTKAQKDTLHAFKIDHNTI